VAVLLGVLFAGEHMTWLQITGLAIILTSVLLINLAKYRKQQAVEEKKNIVKEKNRVLIIPKTKASV